MRSGLTDQGHFQNAQAGEPSTEKKMISARPTRFSAGTKPTGPFEEAAVLRIVAVVAHQEIVLGRHLEDARVVALTVVAACRA